MITKRIEFRYALKPVKLKKGQKPAKPHKPKPPFGVFSRIDHGSAEIGDSATIEKAIEKAKKRNEKSQIDTYVKDADGVVVFSITTTAPNQQEESSEPQSGRADRPDVPDRSSNRQSRRSPA